MHPASGVLPAMLREIIGTRLMIKKAMKRPEYKVGIHHIHVLVD